uniref:Titin n=1 Tax=Xiphophorus couchianus TaxID=32473 RepID=A0A3B5MUU4_9TELE
NAIRPKLQLTFNTFTVKSGEDLKIEILVVGDPAPKIEWKKEGQAVKETSRLEILNKASLTLLHIRHGVREHSGQYSVTASNSAGKDTTTITVVFRVTAKNSAGVWSVPSESITILAQDVIEAPTAFIDPTFKSTIIIQAGETFVIEADYFGKPLPEVAWLKDGKEIEKGTPKIEVKNTITHTTLTARDCTRVDGGRYVLSLSNSGGTTTISVNVKVLDRPGSPDGPLKVKVISAEKCNLNWNPPLNDGGASITHYIIEKRETSRVTWTEVEPHIEDISYKVTKLVCGKEYVFRIAAVNKYGAGDFLESEPFVAQNPFKPPSAPSTPVASAVTGDSVVLTWERPESDGGSEIDGYILEKRDKDGVRWTKCNKRRLNDMRFRCTGLAEGHYYQFRVLAENAAGVGAPSESTFINVRVLDSPSAPTNLEVKDVKRDSVSISWEPPLIDGGTKISHYIVEKREEARKAFTSVCSNCVRNSYKIDNLHQGSFYYFRVIAVNEFGPGQPAETAEAVKVSEAPPPPGKITLSDVTCNSARLSWEKPDHDGGSKIASYTVEMQTRGDNIWTKYSESKALEVTIDGMTAGKEYFFRVSAVNDKGTSEPKSLLTPVVVKDNSAKPVINLLNNTFNVKVGNDLKIDVPFKGMPLPTVVWNKEGNMLKETSRVTVQTSESASQVFIKDATRFDAGVYEVILSNAAGTTSAEIFVNIFERPGPPSDLSVEEVSADFVSLTWQPPLYTGGSEISNYIVEKRDIGSSVWQNVSATVARSSIKVSRLTQGTEYQFRVAAENRYGKSQYLETETVIAQYPFRPPGPPTNIHVVQASKSVMIIAWDKPDSDGGSPIIGYHVESKDQSSILWTKVNRSPVIENQYKVTNVEEGLIYEFRICAENLAGVGPCGKPSESVAARDQCDAPSNLKVTNVTNTSVSLSWDKPHYDGGAKITSYIVERIELPDSCWLKCNFTNLMDTFFEVSELSEGEQYEFRVTAKNAAECFSAPSETTGPITVQHDIEPPIIILDEKFRQVVVVKAGDVLKIDAEIYGRPNPTVFWLKNGRNISTKGRVEILATKSHTSLLVRESVRKDSGQYTLTVQNTGGATSRAVTCKVLDIPGPPAGPLEVSGQSAEKCTLSWGPPHENGGAEVLHYVVEKCETSPSCSHRPYGHPPQSLQSPGLLLRDESSMPQLPMAVKETCPLTNQNMHKRAEIRIPRNV